jgi:hypothetical protein
MDQDRQIRLAIPPFFLLASLLWGAYLGGLDLLFLKPEAAKEVLGLLAATAVVILPIGFLISAISVTILGGLAAIFRKPTYEAVLDGSTLARIWPKLGSNQSKDAKLTLYAAATFDHELLAPGIHTWLLRRWNSFNVAAHSIVALTLAHAVGLFFPIPQGCAWWTTTVASIALLGLRAFKAWRETMKMIEFQSHRQQNGGGVSISRLKCDGARIHAHDCNQTPCIGIAEFWNPETGLCYCERHRHRLIALKHISTMTEKDKQAAMARQADEGLGR